jgi:hypothetical protein
MKPFENWADNLTCAAFLLTPLLSVLLLFRLARFSRRTGRQKKNGIVFAANLLVLLFLLSLGLAGAEIYYRFLLDTTDSFGLTKLNRRWYYRHWRVNQSGYRDSEPIYHAVRTPGKPRLTFLGDSFTVGHGINNVEDRFPNRIRSLGIYEVHIPADIGYDTGHHLQIIEGLIAQDYQFDRVVLVYNLNDIGDISAEWKSKVDQFSSAPPPALLRHSFFLDTCFYRFKGRFDSDIANYCQSLLQCYSGPLWDQQQQRLKSLRKLVESHGGRLLVVTFPFFQHLGPGYEYRPVHAKLDQFWQEIGVPHLDLLSLYESHRNESLVVNAHDAHPNVQAHALAVEAIMDFLRRNAGQPTTTQ